MSKDKGYTDDVEVTELDTDTEIDKADGARRSITAKQMEGMSRAELSELVADVVSYKLFGEGYEQNTGLLGGWLNPIFGSGRAGDKQRIESAIESFLSKVDDKDLRDFASVAIDERVLNQLATLVKEEHTTSTFASRLLGTQGKQLDFSSDIQLNQDLETFFSQTFKTFLGHQRQAQASRSERTAEAEALREGKVELEAYKYQSPRHQETEQRQQAEAEVSELEARAARGETEAYKYESPRHQETEQRQQAEAEVSELEARAARGETEAYKYESPRHQETEQRQQSETEVSELEARAARGETEAYTYKSPRHQETEQRQQADKDVEKLFSSVRIPFTRKQLAMKPDKLLQETIKGLTVPQIMEGKLSTQFEEAGIDTMKAKTLAGLIVEKAIGSPELLADMAKSQALSQGLASRVASDKTQVNQMSYDALDTLSGQIVGALANMTKAHQQATTQTPLR